MTERTGGGQPLVSVIIPTYNNEARIARTLGSLAAQDYPNLELVVVDDASTDGTGGAARRFLAGWGGPSRMVERGANGGQSAARNTGLDAARGDYVLFFDHDDLAERNFISTLTGLIREEGCDIALCGMVDRFEDGRPDAPHPVPLSGRRRGGAEFARLRALSRFNPRNAGCMLLDRGFLRRTGLRFDEGCFAGEDIEFQLKAFCRAGGVAFTRECLYIYIYHPEMTSIRAADTREKSLVRYENHTDAQFRVAEYLSRHGPKELRALAEGLILPEAVVRRLTLHARRNDRAAFDALLARTETRRALRRSARSLFQRPEVPLKAVGLLLLPDLYFRLRSGR